MDVGGRGRAGCNTPNCDVRDGVVYEQAPSREPRSGQTLQPSCPHCKVRILRAREVDGLCRIDHHAEFAFGRNLVRNDDRRDR